MRKCALSLGIHAITGMQKDLDLPNLDIWPLANFSMLDEDLGNFWMLPRHWEAQMRKDHIDISPVCPA